MSTLLTKAEALACVARNILTGAPITDLVPLLDHLYEEPTPTISGLFRSILVDETRLQHPNHLYVPAKESLNPQVIGNLLQLLLDTGTETHAPPSGKTVSSLIHEAQETGLALIPELTKSKHRTLTAIPASLYSIRTWPTQQSTDNRNATYLSLKHKHQPGSTQEPQSIYTLDNREFDLITGWTTAETHRYDQNSHETTLLLQYVPRTMRERSKLHNRDPKRDTVWVARNNLRPLLDHLRTERGIILMLTYES